MAKVKNAAKLSITPLHDRVIVQPAAAEEKAGVRAELKRLRTELVKRFVHRS